MNLIKGNIKGKIVNKEGGLIKKGMLVLLQESDEVRYVEVKVTEVDSKKVPEVSVGDILYIHKGAGVKADDGELFFNRNSVILIE